MALADEVGDHGGGDLDGGVEGFGGERESGRREVGEEDGEARAAFELELADLEAAAADRRRPVDAADLVAGLHLTKGKEVGALAGLWGGEEAAIVGHFGGMDGMGSEGREGDEGGIEWKDFAFDEEREREAGGDLHFEEAVGAAPRAGEAVCGFLFASGSDLQEEALFALVGWRFGGVGGCDDPVFDLDGVGGEAVFLVGDGKGDQARSACKDAFREDAFDLERVESDVREDAADDNQADQHTKDEVEEVVSGIDGGDADAEGQAKKPFAFAGEADLARRAEPTAE